MIDQILRQEKENHHVIQRVQPEINNVSNEKSHLLVLHMANKINEVNKINENNPQIQFTKQHSYEVSIFSK